MTQHWHAYSYTGHTRPPDREARDPLSPTPPLVITEWLTKPRAMLAGTYVDPEAAVGWLAAEVGVTPPLPTALPADALVAYARQRLTETPGDVVTRYYTAGSYVCRDLVRCAGQCPQSPR